MKSKQYKVTAGKITAETTVNEKGGRAEIDFPRGAILPDDVPQAQIDHELRLGTIEELRVDTVDARRSDEDDVPPPPAGSPVDPPALPEGMSVPTTVEWVNDKAGQIRARAEVALNAETGPGGKNRSTLVEQLQEILTAPDQTDGNADSSAGA